MKTRFCVKKKTLLLIAGAGRGVRPAPRLLQRRQQHRCENRDDCNNHQKFDQSERFAHNNGYVKRNSIAARRKSAVCAAQRM